MRGKKELFFWGLVSLYLINDLFYLSSDSYIKWMLVDYTVRLVTLIGLFVLYKEYIIDKGTFCFGSYPLNKTLGIVTVFTIVGVLIFVVIEANFQSLNFYKGTSFPEATNVYLHWFDLTIGLLLVALSEEVLFHSYFYALFKDRLAPRNLIILSALLFSLIHWSNDMTNILAVFIWALIAMKIFLHTKSIWPLVIVHLATNFILFIDVIDTNLFKIGF